MMSSTAPCPYLDHLDAYLDGDLPADETRAFEAHLPTCPACEGELALAERLQTALGAFPEAPCPDAVFEAALDRIARTERDRVPARSTRRLRRWGVGLALAAVLAIALPLLVPRNDAAYSDAEVARAREEVELAFALLAEASHETTQLVRDDAFGRSAAEIRSALQLPR